MKRLLICLLLASSFALPCLGQVNPLFINSSFNSNTAATPTFSPAAGSVPVNQVVTASTATSACSSYLYLGTTDPPTTLQSTYTVTTAVTLYAYVHNCPGYNDSAVATASYTTYVGFSVVQTGTCTPTVSGTATTVPCTWSSGYTGGDTTLYYSLYPSNTASASSVGTLTSYGTTASTNGVLAVITGVSGGTTSFNITIPSTYLNAGSAYAIIYELSGPVSATPVDQYCGWGYGYSATSSCGVTTTGSEDTVCAAATAEAAGTSAMGAETGYSTLSLAAQNPLSGLLQCTTSPVTPNTYTPTWTLNGQAEIGYMTIAFTMQ